MKNTTEELTKNDILKQRAENYKSISFATDKEGTQEDREVLIFTIKNLQYGIYLSEIDYVYRLPQVLQMPQQPPFLKGLFYHDGNIINLIDFLYILNKTSQDFSDTFALILNHEFAIPIEGINNIMAVSEKDLDTEFSKNQAEFKKFLLGVFHHKVALVNSKEILKTIYALSHTKEDVSLKEEL